MFSFPAAPDVVALIVSTFDPTLSPSSKDALEQLLLKNEALATAVDAKEQDTVL
ncbi:MAG: hypothetical protein IH822_04145, partial [Chloroflexi bacterium]|nr:hypothetical protein [Chloroflexota bacterium]